ncbi:MAG TPA: glycoside hydrolase family 15 protein [Myxococcales bacterium]|nr:glycoside hydrolase family 15 protein [Myxococcales bacterium]
MDRRYLPIADYALIGDCHAAALVSIDGAIDWACLARFDAGSVFGRLLDPDRGGTFWIRARQEIHRARRYLPDTNVLETTLTTRSGRARLLDCFTMRRGGRRHPHRQLLRLIEGLEGTVAFDVRVEPRFDYGTLRPWLHHCAAEGVYTAVGGDDAFVLSAECPLRVSADHASLRGEAVVAAGQRKRFSIVSCPPYDMKLEAIPARTADARLRATIDWWRRWVAGGSFPTEHRAAIVRSALTLKLLTCAPTGAIVAAPTTSLPEAAGGSRNWDYRYCWVRDSAVTLAALCQIGHPEVAAGFKRFIERSTAGRAEDLQVLYGCYGERRVAEEELPLAGYRRSKPVRAGNAAAQQRQLDLYGELLEGAHFWRARGSPLTDDGWRFLASVVEAARRAWREPDQGIWESRGPPRHFVHSKVMCWAALNRGIQAAEEAGLPAPLARWRAARREIRAAVERDGVDPRTGSFVQAFGSREVDASLLRLALVGFVGVRDPRMLATVARIRRELDWGGLTRRYRTEAGSDGLPGREGAFLMASFWMVQLLALQGELAEAEERFRRLLALGNDVGLFAEEYDPDRRELLGNFPQAYTHVALIHAAEALRVARARRAGAAPGREESRAASPA